MIQNKKKILGESTTTSEMTGLQTDILQDSKVQEIVALQQDDAGSVFIS